MDINHEELDQFKKADKSTYTEITVLLNHRYRARDGSYAPVFQSERISINTAKKSSLVLLNGILMLETKVKDLRQFDILANRVRGINAKIWCQVDDNTWPPEQPKSFTPLLLIHSKGIRTQSEVTAIAKLTYVGDISKVTSDNPAVKCATLNSHEKCQSVLDSSRTTEKIEVILAPLVESKEAPLEQEDTRFILIEGAPGIGKSMLLKEVAYQWGIQKLLQMYELVLLVCLRDPYVIQASSVDDLLYLFYKGEEDATEIVPACSKYLSKNGGRTLVLLLDGYDEYPGDLQKCSLIADIIKRKVLPFCGLVVSSRPHASGHFHTQATIRVDILGFTETERELYIKQALPDQPHKIEELTQYLNQHSSIDSICYIPFNMVILIYLYKLEIPLPKNSTELYHHFICSTIFRHLTKLSKPLENSTDLTDLIDLADLTDLADLPEPYNRIIQQLSKLSLEALNKNKLIFTIKEIKAACPDIAATPEAINGFGLLQAVQHFGLYKKTMTVNFTHFTIQEYLAAHYISHLPPNEELEVIQANFWSDIHFNMFSMYTSLTKGQRPAFKEFLSGGNASIAISPEFLGDQLQCLRLYHCFKEADDHMMCDSIEQAEIFRSKRIQQHYVTAKDSDLECISVFLTSSFNKEWKILYLQSHHIQDKGLNILYRGLRHNSDITIDALWLQSNGLTIQSSSMISELTVKCKVKQLLICENYTIGENQQLYSMLTDPCSVLWKLNMFSTGLSSSAAKTLFTALKDNNKLKELYLESNAITDDALEAITTALESNSCLVTLGMYRNPLSSKAVINIIQCLKVNNTLGLLGVPDCYLDRSIQETIIVNEERKRRGYRSDLYIEFGNVFSITG